MLRVVREGGKRRRRRGEGWHVDFGRDERERERDEMASAERRSWRGWKGLGSGERGRRQGGLQRRNGEIWGRGGGRGSKKHSFPDRESVCG